jgi:hypothetical protein
LTSHSGMTGKLDRLEPDRVANTRMAGIRKIEGGTGDKVGITRFLGELVRSRSNDFKFESEPPTALEVVTHTDPSHRKEFSAFRWLRGLHGGQELPRHWTLIVQPGPSHPVRFKDIAARVVPHSHS